MNRYTFFPAVFFVLFCLSCTNQIKLFIAPDGDDVGNGALEQPFLTLQQAKDAVRQIRKDRPDKQIVVIVRGGEYPVREPVLFNFEDSGDNDSPVIYRSAEGEEPVFTGSNLLSEWHLLEEPGKLELLDPAVREKIYMTNLKDAGINDFGDPVEIGNRPELFCNGDLQTLSRWPNEGFTKAGLVRGDTESGIVYTNKRGTVEGVFEYIDENMDRWAKEREICFGGYWYVDWYIEYQKAESIDIKTKTICIEEPYHRYGYRDSLRYFGLNLFCEIDQPGEWYLDRSDGILYWYPPEGIDISDSKVTLSMLNAPYMIEAKDCSNLVFEGLTFRESRGSGILISEGNNCLVSGCRIERFGQDGIHIDNGKGHGISGCLLDFFGCGGIKINGGDRRKLIPAGHFVENTVIENFSLFKRTYEPAVYLGGCGSRINNNRFRYSSSSAMRLEGNDLIVEYNQISHVVNESDDQGGLDMWYNPSYRGIVIRYNHWSDIKGGTRFGAAGVRLDDMISEVMIYGNLFERVGSHHFGGVQIHGGKDNIVENNLFYKCLAAVSFYPWGEEMWLERLDSPVIKEKIYKEVDIRSPLYQSKYPGLKNIRKDADMNIVRNNLLAECKNRFLRDNKKQIFENIFENNTSVNADSKTIEYFCDPAILEKYGLKPIPFQKIGPKNNKWLLKN